MAAARQVSQMLRRSSADHVAIVVWKTHDRIHVGHIDPLRVGSERIEGHAERNIQSASKDLHLLWLALCGQSPEHLDVARTGLGEKDVAVGSNPHQPWIVQ